MFTFKKVRALVTLVAAAGVMGGVMAAVPMQTTQDKADGNRLIINGHKVFISGMNIAWNNFGNEAGDNPVTIGAFVNQFKQIKGAGGNAVRWWLHTDARSEPKMDANGKMPRIGTKTIDNIRQVLDSANSYGVVVSLCLFSFDLLQLDGKDQSTVDRNKKFLTVPANLDSYISTVLTPMLNAVGNHPAIMCWEVFNEPEGMSSDAGGWSDGGKVPMSDILRFTARIAAVVHDKTLKMASTGIHEYGKMKTWYSDSKLRSAAGSDPLASKAYLDFYMAHYYPEYIGTDGSPFHHPASFWGMDRPILIGEFPAKSWNSGYYTSIQTGTGMTVTAAYEYAYNNGYCGALSWSMNQAPANKFGDFSTTQPALQNLSSKHKADIEIGGNTVVTPTGDQVMKVAIKSLPTGDPQAELGKEGALNLSGKTNLTFDVYIASGSGTNMKIVPVVKVGSDWVWSPATNYVVDLSTKTAGQWFTVTVPIANGFVPEKGSFSASDIKAIILQFQPTGSAYTGTIYIDNIKADNTVLYNFDDMGSEWSATKWVNNAAAPVSEITTSQVAKSSVSNSTGIIGGKTVSGASRAPIAAVTGRTLKVNGLDNAETSVKLVNLKGKIVANFKTIGNGSFGLNDIPSGNYLVELTTNGKKLGSSRIVVR